MKTIQTTIPVYISCYDDDRASKTVERTGTLTEDKNGRQWFVFERTDGNEGYYVATGKPYALSTSTLLSVSWYHTAHYGTYKKVSTILKHCIKTMA